MKKTWKAFWFVVFFLSRENLNLEEILDIYIILAVNKDGTNRSECYNVSSTPYKIIVMAINLHKIYLFPRLFMFSVANCVCIQDKAYDYCSSHEYCRWIKINCLACSKISMTLKHTRNINSKKKCWFFLSLSLIFLSLIFVFENELINDKR